MTSGDNPAVRPPALLSRLLPGRTTAFGLLVFEPSLLPISRPRIRFRPPAIRLLAMAAGTNPTPGAPDSPTIGRRTASSHATSPSGLDEGHGSPSGVDTGSTNSSDQEVDPEIDPDDLHALVVEHSDAIYRLALSVVRDPALAEDVAQESLVKAWLALPTFRGDASLRGWLLRITHNTAISTLRRRRAVVLDPHDLPEQQTRVDRSVEARVQGRVVMDEFVAALDTLDELSRSIVVLRELEGLTYDEIAAVLSVPMPTVKTRLLRARRRLGNALRDWT